MNFKKNFNAMYKEYLKSAILKSLLFSALISCTVLSIISFVFWIVDVKQFWIALIVFGVLEISLFFVVFNKIKPTEKKLAKKLDELGLQERVITMYQYQNDDSLMSKIQRENAIQHISKVNTKLVKLAIPAILIVFFCVAFLSSTTTTVLAALSSNDVIESGSKLINNELAKKEEYTVSYEVLGEGFIEGDIFQVVEEGNDASAVLALPEDGWAFYEWIVENKATTNCAADDPYRVDTNVQSDLVIYARFVEISNFDDNKEPNDDFDENNLPTPPQEGGSQMPCPPNPNGDSEEGGGKYDENNQVIDGQTYYGGSTYDEAYSDAMNDMQQDSSMSDDLKDTISSYYKNIE